MCNKLNRQGRNCKNLSYYQPQDLISLKKPRYKPSIRSRSEPFPLATGLTAS